MSVAPKINRKLNIVIHLTRENGQLIRVHCAPISREVLDRYLLLLGETFSQLYKMNLDIVAGPRMAMKVLRRVCEAEGVWQEVQTGLVQEMVRLSNVIFTDAAGNHVMVPMYDAITRKLIDGDDCDEIDGVLCFFTLTYAVHFRGNQNKILGGLVLWDTQTTSLNVTEYLNSLKKSTVEEPIGEPMEDGVTEPLPQKKVEVASVPF